MKNIIYFSLILLFVSFNNLNAQIKWDYTVYKTITNSGVKLFTLEYGINSKGYDGKVKWRLTNHTNVAIYDVSINNKTYTLLDGREEKGSGESMDNHIGPGEYGTTAYDPVNSSENYGNWSDKNDNTVKRILVESPEILFKDEKDGIKYGWDSFGLQSTKKANAANKGVSENAIENYNYKQKRREYLEFIRVGDQAFNNSNWSEASKYYKSAVSMDFDPDMYPDLPTRYSIIQKYARTNQKINAARNSEKIKSTNNYSPDYDQPVRQNAQPQRDYNQHTTNDNSYNKTSNYSSQKRSENTSNSSWEQWAEDYKKQASNNEAEFQQSLDNLSNTIVGIAQQYQRANEEAKQRELERERRREAEEERKAAERRRIYNEKRSAMNKMDAFERVFRSYFNKDIDHADSCEVVFFYFGTVNKNFDSKSGSLYISNIFPVYKISSNRWPFISDIMNEIENDYGNVIMRGYFTSLHEARRDLADIYNYARNSFIREFYVNQYQFQFNKQVNNHSETDFWGNSVSNEESKTKKTDFWGNVIESESKGHEGEPDATNTNTKE